MIYPRPVSVATSQRRELAPRIDADAMLERGTSFSARDSMTYSRMIVLSDGNSWTPTRDRAFVELIVAWREICGAWKRERKGIDFSCVLGEQ